MAKETKLGPSITYHNLGGDAPRVILADRIEIENGETVNLVDELGKAAGEALLAKLAGNPYFAVEGNDADSDHDEARERIADESGRERRKPKARTPNVKKSVARRIAAEDRENADDGKGAGEGTGEGEGSEGGEDELPDDVKTPESATLENNTRPRLPRARRGS
jgi:hypothetical protein